MRLMKKSKPFSYLWIIPIVLVIDVICAFVAMMMDIAFQNDFPAFTLLSFTVLSLISGVGFIVSVVLTIYHYIDNKDKTYIVDLSQARDLSGKEELKEIEGEMVTLRYTLPQNSSFTVFMDDEPLKCKKVKNGVGYYEFEMPYNNVRINIECIQSQRDLSQPLYCPKCGTLIEEGNLCPCCGAKVL